MIKVVNNSNGVESQFTAEAWEDIKASKEWKDVFSEVKPDKVQPPKEIAERNAVKAEPVTADNAKAATEKNAKASK